MLSKKNRLTKRGSFSYVYRSGQRREGKLLKLLYVKSSSLRIGFSISAKIGKAHARNLLKRRLRAAVRIFLRDIKNGWQMVFIAKQDAAEAEYKAVESEIKYLLNGL